MGSPRPVEYPEPVILFDGVCNLCSGAVQFIIRRDPSKHFRFASLQSDFGQRQLERFNLSDKKFHSLILISDNRYYERSDAALNIARRLTGGWPLLYGFKIIPRFLRNAIYNLVAKNRYKLFGKKEICWIPTTELRSRFKD